MRCSHRRTLPHANPAKPRRCSRTDVESSNCRPGSRFQIDREAKTFLGRGATLFRATLFEKTTRTNWLIPWHQDTALPLASRFDAPGWGPWYEKAQALHAHAPAWALSRVI